MERINDKKIHPTHQFEFRSKHSTLEKINSSSGQHHPLYSGIRRVLSSRVFGRKASLRLCLDRGDGRTVSNFEAQPQSPITLSYKRSRTRSYGKITRAPWCIRNDFLHSDLNWKQLKARSLTSRYESRLHSHVNVKTIKLLDVPPVRRLRRKFSLFT